MSRQRPNDSASHEVLGVQQFKPLELAEQINLNMNNAWGILMTLIDIFLKKQQGKYLILKDPNKVSVMSICMITDLATYFICMNILVVF